MRRGSRTSSPATRCSRAPRARASTRSGSSCSATRTSARTSSRRSSCRATSTARKVPGALRRLGITANGGQEQLKGRILRIAHCGYFGAFDILTSLSGLEMVLHELGRDVEHGAGVGAAQRVFLEAGVPAAA